LIPFATRETNLHEWDMPGGLNRLSVLSTEVEGKKDKAARVVAGVSPREIPS